MVWLTKKPSTPQILSGTKGQMWKINSRRAWEIFPNFTKDFFLLEVYPSDSNCLQIVNFVPEVHLSSGCHCSEFIFPHKQCYNAVFLSWLLKADWTHVQLNSAALGLQVVSTAGPAEIFKFRRSIKSYKGSEPDLFCTRARAGSTSPDLQAMTFLLYYNL